MTFTEKNTLIFLVVSALGLGVYAALVFSRAQGVPLVEVAYAAPMLWTIGGAIVAGIVGQTVLSALEPKEAREKDQRDRDIDRFGILMGQSFIVIGGVVALLLTMAEAKYFWIANTLYLGFVLSALVGSSARLIAYRRGLPQ